MINAAPAMPPARAFVGASAALVLGQFGIIFAPFLLPFAMQRLAIGNLEASRLISIELLAYLVAALLASTAKTFAPRAVAVIGCALYAMGSAGAALAPGSETFLIARILCGIGGGLALVAANRTIASHHGFERMLAVAIISVVIVATLGLVAVPAAFESRGAATAYFVLGGLAAMAALLSLLISNGTRFIERGRSLAFGNAAWLLIAAYFLSRLSDAALWPYIETFGGRVGLGPSVVGIILAVATLLAIAGPLLALRVVSTRAVVVLFLATLTVKAIAPLIMLLVPTQQAYVVAQILVSATVVLSGQIFLARFSELDAGGRLAGFGSTAGLAADTAGLPITAQVFAGASFLGVAALATGIGFVAILLCIAAFAARDSRLIVDEIR